MMLLRATIVVAAAAFFAAAAPGAGPAAPDTSRMLWQGPLLAGDGVVWGEESDAQGSLHLWTQGHGDRTVYSSDSLGGPVAASRTLLAFERTYPSCPPQPGLACPGMQDIVVGRLRGPFVTLVPPHKCVVGAGVPVAVYASVAAYIDLSDCAHYRVAVREVGRDQPPVVLREASVDSGCCSDIAIAGRYVAWNNDSDIVVYDRLARRVAYRAHLSSAHSFGAMGLDLQLDGKLAVAYRSTEVYSPWWTIAWFSPSEPRPHVLPLRGRSQLVRIAGDRIAIQRFLTAKKSALVVTDLAGRARTLARFAPPTRLRGGFDFDGHQIVWASDRVTSTRMDCPPPGQERPCVRRETGVTSVRLRTDLTGASRLVARLPFDDTVAQP